MNPIATEFNPALLAGGVKDIMKNLGATSSDLWKVHPKDLHVLEGLNVRVKDERYQARVRSIADSIKVEGFHIDQPIGVFVHEGKLCVGSGHRRTAGALLAISEGAALEAVPVVVKPRSTSIQDLTVELHTTNNGDPLSAYELAVLCKRMVNFQWEEKKIATAFGISTTYLDQLLTLMGAPIDLLRMVHEGKLAAGTAYDIFKKHGADAVAVANGAVEKATSEGRKKATARDLEGAKFKRTLNKVAPSLYEAVRELRDDPAAMKIRKGTWDRIQACLDQMDGCKA